jgi:hypothetical protein
MDVRAQTWSHATAHAQLLQFLESGGEVSEEQLKSHETGRSVATLVS